MFVLCSVALNVNYVVGVSRSDPPVFLILYRVATQAVILSILRRIKVQGLSKMEGGSVNICFLFKGCFKFTSFFLSRC